jgi:HEAT repeat protein
MKSLLRLLFTAVLALATTGLRAANEQEFITILQSSAGIPEKCAACQQLRIIGTAQSVPALAALLAEDRTAHAARYALEAIPAPEAVAALRAALGRTSGLLKVGVIDSLGRRRDPGSLSLLKPLLAGPDPVMAAHAATALGEIGGPEALAALSSTRTKSAPAVQSAVDDALLQCAEQLRAGGDSRGAARIYRDLFNESSPSQIRAAAWRGLALSDAGRRVDRITTALAGGDRLTHAAALKLVRELDDSKVVKACLKQWAGMPEDSQIAVLDAGLRLGDAAMPAVRAAAVSDRPGVRVAAWQALATLGDTSLLPALADAAARGAPSERCRPRRAHPVARSGSGQSHPRSDRRIQSGGPGGIAARAGRARRQGRGEHAAEIRGRPG